MFPGAYPLEELEAALLRVADNPPASLIEQLEDGERGLLRAVKRILPAGGSELVLVLDQLEEVFTLVEDEERRTHFLAILERAVARPARPASRRRRPCGPTSTTGLCCTAASPSCCATTSRPSCR